MNNFFSIISIDPGSNLGISVIQVDAKTLNILNIESTTVVRDIKIYQDPCNKEITRDCRLLRQSEIVQTYLQQIRPSYFVVESPYYNPRMPTAFKSLVETLTMLRQTLFNYDPYMAFDTIDPSSIKKSVGANGIAGKDAVKVAIASHQELYPFLSHNLNYLDEHAIDSIAIGYCLLMRIRSVFNVNDSGSQRW